MLATTMSDHSTMATKCTTATRNRNRRARRCWGRRGATTARLTANCTTTTSKHTARAHRTHSMSTHRTSTHSTSTHHTSAPRKPTKCAHAHERTSQTSPARAAAHPAPLPAGRLSCESSSWLERRPRTNCIRELAGEPATTRANERAVRGPSTTQHAGGQVRERVLCAPSR